MDYTALVGDVDTVGSIKRFVNWSRVDSAGILDEAQAWIYQRLRVRQMTAAADIPIALNDTSVTLPTGYLDPIQFGIPGHIPRLRYWDVERFRSHLGWDENAVLPVAVPTIWCDFAQAIQFNHKSDAAYTGKMVYYRQPTALGPSNLTNFLTDRYPTLLRRACLMFALDERKEMTKMAEMEVRCLAMIDDIRVESDLSYRGMELDFGWSANE